jgi:flagellar motor switch protein FliG
MDEEGLVDSAILLLALGEEAAAEVFRHLAPKEVERLGEAMTRLRSTDRDRLQQVLERFDHTAGRHDSLVADNDAYVRRVLTRALGEDRARPMLERVAPQAGGTGIERLKWMDAESVAAVIAAEHPQIIASVLVHLERDHAAAVLAALGEGLRRDVVLRIARLDSIQPAAMEELDAMLSAALATGDVSRAAKLGGSKTAAELLNMLGGGDAGVLDAIRERDPELAQEIEDRMFTFDDLIRVDDRGIQTLLREVQSDQLVVALKGADPALREKVFRNMSQRAAESLREDLEARGPMRISEVEAQQREILQTARRLADEGQIVIGTGNENALV